MLHLRSFRDFPEVFVEGEESRMLSPRELELFSAFKSRPAEQMRWLRGRLTLKELCRRYAETHWATSVELRDVSVLQRTNLTPYVEFEPAVRSQVRGPLAVQLAHCGAYTAAAVRPALPGHSFGIALDPVEPRFPFFADDLFTDAEHESLRNLDQATADHMLAAFGALKHAAGTALGVPAMHLRKHVEVCSNGTEGYAALRCVTRAGAPVEPSRVRARHWRFDHHVLAFVAIWTPPATPPHALEKVEEEPVLPDQRFFAHHEWEGLPS